MTDTITESFCERCGTRYSFDQTAKTRRGGIGRVRVLGRGLKNYVSNDGMPMAEAMSAARDDEARAGVARQLDAFHKTFNFCMSCRQYTCPNCWNTTAGECLTCAPDLTREVLPAPFPELPAAGAVAAGNGHETADAMAWPRVDLDRGEPEPEAAAAAAAAFEVVEVAEEPEILARLDAFVATPPHAAVEELTPDELAEIENALAATHPAAEETVVAEVVPVAEVVAAEDEPMAALDAVEVVAAEMVAAEVAEPDAGPAADAEADASIAAAAAAEPAAEVATPTDQMDVGRGQTRSLLGRFRPGRPAAVAPEQTAPTPEPIAAAEPEPTPVASAGPIAAAEPEPEPVAAAEPEPTPVAAEPEPEPVAAAEPEAVAAAEPEPTPVAAAPEAGPRQDTIEQPTWRVVAPESAPSEPAAAPGPPAWPTQPAPTAKPGQVPGPGASPWASRLATARPETTSVWAASAQQVLGGPVGANAPHGTPAVQSCVSCGLSLSANARFCRRCGTRQG